MINPESLSRAFSAVAADRSKALEEQIERKNKIYRLSPSYAKTQRSLRNIGACVATAFFSDEAEKEIDNLARKSLALQEKAKEILSELGYAPDYLDIHYHCNDCKDTGRVNGKICKCVKEKAVEIDLKDISCYAPIEECTFENFDLSFYKNSGGDNEIYEKTKRIYEYMKAYSEDFHTHSKSIYMFGRTGLGKTHLALAAARKIIENGHFVVYGTASNIFSSLEDEKFKHISAKYSMEKLCSAELLVIDDLGAEFFTSFTAAALHNVIENRLLSRKPVFITTNLGISDINKKYGERIASRIIGEYEPIKFEGSDIRQAKRFDY